MVRFQVAFNWYGTTHYLLLEAEDDFSAVAKAKLLDADLPILSVDRVPDNVNITKSNLIFVDFRKRKRVAA